MPARGRPRSASSGVRLGALALAGAMTGSLLGLLPNMGGARATTLAPLAWGSNDHAQLGRCDTPSSVPDDPRCLDPAYSAMPVEVAGLGDVTQFSAGLHHNLARRADGTVWAWGRNIENQLGDGHSVYTTASGPTTGGAAGIPDPSPDQPAPVQVFEGHRELITEPDTEPPIPLTPQYRYTFTPLTGVRAVAAGGYHSLAVKDDGTVWSWGENYCGQLGDGKVQEAGRADLSPPGAGQVPGLSGVVAVAAGRGHSLALDEDGALWAWGDNRWGQVGNGGSRPRRTATCAMPDDGPDGYAQVVPTRVQLAAKVVALAAGSDHSLAVTDDGQVWSWGNNCSGQLGAGPAADISAFRKVPVPVSGLPAGDVVAVAAGGAAFGGHSLALTDGGEVWAWGLADVLGTGSASGPAVSPCLDDPVFMNPNTGDGQDEDVAGMATQDGRLAPARVLDAGGTPLGDVVALDAGVFHSLAVQDDDELYAWGRNEVGELGPLAQLAETGPAAVRVLDGTVTAVSAGSHSLALPGGSNPATTTNTGSITTTSQPTTTTTTTGRRRRPRGRRPRPRRPRRHRRAGTGSSSG